MARVYLSTNTCKFRCPGCGQWHRLPIDQAGPPPHWAFTGDADSPTLSPSILARGLLCIYDDVGRWSGEYESDAAGDPLLYVCHGFLRNGRMEFLSDCTHVLAGQTVELPELKAL